MEAARERNAEATGSVAVIPGRAGGANPESRHERRILIWIPDPALRAVPE